jgi:hypothetical protein
MKLRVRCHSNSLKFLVFESFGIANGYGFSGAKIKEGKENNMT